MTITILVSNESAYVARDEFYLELKRASLILNGHDPEQMMAHTIEAPGMDEVRAFLTREYKLDLVRVVGPGIPD